MIKLTVNEIKNQGVDGVLYALPDRIGDCIKKLPLCIKLKAFEIRLRAGRPVTLTMDRNFYVSADSEVSTYLPKNPLIISESEIKETVIRLCERSLYTKTGELNFGFISMKNGNRAGICGSFKDGVLGSVSSINIRIARSVKGAAKSLYHIAEKGLLIAGGPGSGKTTLLRDLIRHLSNSGKRVCVVDSRGEIAALCSGAPTLDVGLNTDVIGGAEKEKGLEIAVRTMFPEIVAFDEIANREELDRLFEGFFAGVTIIATAHIGSKAELLKRPLTARLLKEGVVGKVAWLSGEIGGEPEILSLKDIEKYA